MIKKVNRKALDIKFSGRSSDFITPSFGFGCLYKCAYCYMRRHNPEGLSIAQNTEDILTAIVNHHEKLGNKKPNQTHETKWTYDISCNEDFALHWKYHRAEFILDTLISKDIFPTFATKCVNKELLKYNPKKQARIRFSLMPQEYSNELEPNTSKILDRIKAINEFYDAGWDVHINFSPIIYRKGAKNLYEKLFKQINSIVREDIKPFVKAEVIFLTHNEKMHLYNLENHPEAEKLIWQPDMQETKISSYGSKNIRYKWREKVNYIRAFNNLHKELIPWNRIRYIF